MSIRQPATLRQFLSPDELRRLPVVVLLLGFAAFTVLSVAGAVYQVSREWLLFTVELGPLHLHVLPYPSLILFTLLVFWLGFSWAAIPAFLALLSAALYTGVPLPAAVLLAGSDPMFLGIYALVYRSFAVRHDLRGAPAMLTFVTVSLIASLAGSPGAFIWSHYRGFGELEHFALWEGWVLGAFLQSLLVSGPLLYLLSQPVERLKQRLFDIRPREPLSPSGMLVAPLAMGGVLSAFTLTTGLLIARRLEEVGAVLPEALGQTLGSSAGALQLLIWLVAALIATAALGAAFIAVGWRRSLDRQVERRTDQLRASELRFQGIFNQAFGLLAITDRAGVLLDVNDTALRHGGYLRDHMLGRPLWETGWWQPSPQEQERLREGIVQAGSGKVTRGEVSYFLADGSKRIADRSISPVLNPEGEVTYVIVEARDITGLRYAQRQLAEYARNLQRLSRNLIEAQEQERRHIARELHDQIGQALTALKFNLHAMATLSAEASTSTVVDDSRRLVEEVLQQIRDLSLLLRPPLLDELGLKAALEGYVERQAARAGLEVLCEIDEDLPRVRWEVETACFRIAQEALGNVLRHAEARRAHVILQAREATLVLTVADDGKGFPVEEVQAAAQAGRSFGLMGMRERIELVGGSVEIDSAPGQGTRVMARFPLKPAMRRVSGD